MSKVAALVLAGSRQGPADPMAVAAHVTHKALIPVGGRPMILRVIEALERSPRIGQIAVVIENAAALAPLNLGERVAVLPAADGPSLSVRHALETLGTPLLVTTADHALLEPEWVDYFLAHVPADADVAAALAPQAKVMAAVPGTRRTFLRFSDGAFSGCNLFYFSTPKANRAVAFWGRMETERKHPLRMARILGIATLLRYVTRTLSLSGVARHLGRLTNLSVSLVQLPYGLAAVDVDKPADLELVEQVLKRGGQTF
ncbi:MAG: NTP transferase domain-containing protein [Parvibaculaceae bacterium]|nr:NTP transferase domain-containing protein [Parvibaculaceae bacterium]